MNHKNSVAGHPRTSWIDSCGWGIPTRRQWTEEEARGIIFEVFRWVSLCTGKSSWSMHILSLKGEVISDPTYSTEQNSSCFIAHKLAYASDHLENVFFSSQVYFPAPLRVKTSKIAWDSDKIEGFSANLYEIWQYLCNSSFIYPKYTKFMGS